MNKVQKLGVRLNEEFREKLVDAVRTKFGIEVQNDWNLFSMRLVTTRADGLPFTSEQLAWIEAYSEGFAAAMEVVATS